MAPEKKKHRFNLFDAVVIILILAVAAGVYLISHRSSGAETTVTTYTVELTELPEGAGAYVNVGDVMTDTQTNKPLGTVVSVEEVPYTMDSTDFDNNVILQAEVEGYCTLLITMESDTTETDSTITTVNGTIIRIGTECSLSNASIKGAGYILSIER